MRFLSFWVLFLSLFILVRCESNYQGALLNKDLKPVDVIFILDSSANIYIEKWLEGLSFIEATVNLLKIRKNSRFAVISYSCKVDTAWDLKSDKAINFDDIHNNLSNLKKSNGVKNTYLALYETKNIFQQSKFLHVNEEVSKVAILLIDGPSSKVDETKETVKLLLNDGINLFIFNLGENEEEYDRKLLNCNSDDCPNFIHTTWQNLNTHVYILINKILDENITEKYCNLWSEWSLCDCLNHKQQRRRTLKSSAKLDDRTSFIECPSEIKNCTPTDNCSKNAVPGDWNEWGECTATCGSGTRIRKRKPPKVVEENGGLSLADQNIPEVMTENCPNLVPCALCAFDWTEWTECSATCDIAYRTRHSARRYLSDHVCKTFENEQCKDLPTCEGSKTEESKSGTSTTTVLAACGASVAAACLLGGAGYYAKNALSSSPVMDAANFESADVDQSIEETENEEAVTIDADSELWMQDGEF